MAVVPFTSGAECDLYKFAGFRRCQITSRTIVSLAMFSGVVVFPLLCLVVVEALEVSNGSSCTPITACNGPSLTFNTDISCVDADYVTTAVGQAMAACLGCESKSTWVDQAVDTSQNNDIYWFLCTVGTMTVKTCSANVHS